jgi:hypothetical protein
MAEFETTVAAPGVFKKSKIDVATGCGMAFWL